MSRTPDTEYFLYKEELIPAPMDLIYGPEIYRIHVRGKSGRGNRSERFENLYERLKVLNDVRSTTVEGSLPKPPASVRNLNQVAVHFLYFVGENLRSYFWPVVHQYHRRVLRQQASLDIAYPVSESVVQKTGQYAHEPATVTPDDRPQNGCTV